MQKLRHLIHRLSPIARQAIEASANHCIQNNNEEIDIEDFFYHLLKHSPSNDLTILLEKYQVSIQAVILDLNEHIQSRPKFSASTPIFSKSIVILIEHADAIASTDHSPNIRSAHLLISLLTVPQLLQQIQDSTDLFNTLPLDHIQHKYTELTKKSTENKRNIKNTESSILTYPQKNEFVDQQDHVSILNKYTVDLTAKAQHGKIDPVIGREHEIRLMLDILMRRRQNNPILTGDPGVGKTAVVEGLALKIIQQDVPPQLKNVQLLSLDMGLLQAGASVKGEFENRLKLVIQAVQDAEHPIILFIDEAHSLIGAGGTAGQHDAANLLKPALARGELRTIAATTWVEYKKYFEKDAALSRRFQVVKVEEPETEVAIDMLRAMTPLMAQHFNLTIRDEAIVASVLASDRYMSHRQLPDKAISVLDTAASRVALSQTAQPRLVESLTAQNANLKRELDFIQNDNALGAFDQQRVSDLQVKIETLEQKINHTTLQWEHELALVTQLKAFEDKASVQYASLYQDLIELQNNQAMVHLEVNEQVVNQVISDWTGIPIGKMVKDDIDLILNLEKTLAQHVIGQDHVLHQLVQEIKISKAKLEDPNKPQAVFLFVGPSGVGKTETAYALAQTLYAGSSHLISINMSEYQEAHTVSALKGAPPGYVGYGQGGILTEAVRQHPYSVILLDEVEKAHGDVLELFYQVFDKGVLEDGEGQIIDFKNTIIILTSNVGSGIISQCCTQSEPDAWPTPETLLNQLKPILYQKFKAAFLSRLRIIPFYCLNDTVLIQIIKIKLDQIALRLDNQYKIKLEYNDDFSLYILDLCTDIDSGARNIAHILNASILPALSTEILLALNEQSLPTHIFMSIIDGEINYKLEQKLNPSEPIITDSRSLKLTKTKVKTKARQNSAHKTPKTKKIESKPNESRQNEAQSNKFKRSMKAKDSSS